MEFRQLVYASKSGFTLIETLIVLLIIGILSSITVIGLGNILKETNQQQFSKIINFFNNQRNIQKYNINVLKNEKSKIIKSKINILTLSLVYRYISLNP